VTEDKARALKIIRNYSFGKGYEHLNILPSLFSPSELQDLDTSQRDFIRSVNQGLILWEQSTGVVPMPVSAIL